MKSSKTFTSLSIFLILAAFNSCKKEPEVKKAEKVSTTKCPRLASLTTVKSSALYTVSTYAGADYNSDRPPLGGDIINGTLCDARFIWPHGITINQEGIIFVSDEISNIRRIDTKGMVSTFAGKTDGSVWDNGDEDGPGAVANFRRPTKMMLNKDGNLYVIDQDLRAIRKVSPSAEVNTYISSYPREAGYQDGLLPEAKFDRYLYSFASGPDGSIYLYEGSNLIRKITPEGLVSTFAGQIPVNGEPQVGYQDGPKENALFGGVSDMTFAPDGSLYFCDRLNNKLRKITPAGMVETVTDLINPLENWISQPSIAISQQGTVYLSNSSQIFRVDADGMLQEVAGSLTRGHKDGVGTQARFRGIKKMAIYKNYMYITDGTTVRRMNIE